MTSMKRAFAVLIPCITAVLVASSGAKADGFYRESLRDLPGVYVIVEAPSPEARAAGIDTAAIRSRVEQYLTLHGVPVLTKQGMLETGSAPKLHVQISAGGRATQPILWVADIVLYQNVTTAAAIGSVPAGTWLGLTGFGLTPPAELKRAVWSAVEGQLEEFTTDWIAANDAQE